MILYSKFLKWNYFCLCGIALFRIKYHFTRNLCPHFSGDTLNQFYKNLSLWLVIGIVFFTLFSMFDKPITTQKEIMYSDFMELVNGGEIIEVTMKGNQLLGKMLNGKTYLSYAPDDPGLVNVLRQKNVRIEAIPKDEGSWLMNAFVSWFPMILLLAIWIFFMRQMQGGGNKALTFGKSRAQVLDKDKNKITFKDVAGIDEAREEVEEIIEFLRTPERFAKLGGKIPKGVLLTGPPGTGKTLLAKAIAGEADVPFFSMSGSDFVEMFVGVGASRVRDLFEQGKKNAPCIVFIDEIDAVGRHRGAGMGGGHDEREQTLNQLLVEMDGFESTEGVILIASTNRADVLDPALTRPGRFDRHIFVDRPDIRGREEILGVHTKKVSLDKDVVLSILARGTPGFTGADLANLVNEAALLAARGGKPKVDMEDFENAKDKVMMGLERRSLLLSDEEKKNTAYHESGHALVAYLLPETDPVHKITIIPRGRALGLTLQLPEEDKHTYTRRYVENQLAILLGGRVAEEIALKMITTGAGNDIERVTQMAHKMVCLWGMSEKLGPLNYGKGDGPVFMGRDMGGNQDSNSYSEQTAEAIDQEVRRLVDAAYETARTIITEHYDLLEAMSQALLKHETLEADDVKAICEGDDLELYWKKKEARIRRKERQRKIAKAKSDAEEQEKMQEELENSLREDDDEYDMYDDESEDAKTPIKALNNLLSGLKETYQQQKDQFEEKESSKRKKKEGKVIPLFERRKKKKKIDEQKDAEDASDEINDIVQQEEAPQEDGTEKKVKKRTSATKKKETKSKKKQEEEGDE